METDENDKLLCQVCAKRAKVPCRCAAIYFCCEAHRSVFSSSQQHPDSDCARFAEQLRRGAPELDSLLESVVAKRPSPRDACSVLREAGVHGRGLFASCCPCGGSGGGGGGGGSRWPALPATTASAAALPPLASLLLLSEGDSTSQLLLRPLTSRQPPKGWREYLIARGVLRPPVSPPSSASSPAAATAAAAAAMTLLHRPLTASLALDAAGWWSVEGEGGRGGREGSEGGGRRGKDGVDDEHDEDDDENANEPPRPFVLHVVGASVDAEVAQWPSWLELAALGGGKETGEEPRRNRSLVVTLVGPTVPASLDGASAAFSRTAGGSPSSSSSASSASAAAAASEMIITIGFARGRYHDVVGSLEHADAVAAEKQKEERGDETRRGGGRFRVTDPKLNPFRSPARTRAPGGTALPAAAGGWAFWILEEKEEL